MLKFNISATQSQPLRENGHNHLNIKETAISFFAFNPRNIDKIFFFFLFILFTQLFLSFFCLFAFSRLFCNSYNNSFRTCFIKDQRGKLKWMFMCSHVCRVAVTPMLVHGLCNVRLCCVLCNRNALHYKVLSLLWFPRISIVKVFRLKVRPGNWRTNMSVHIIPSTYEMEKRKIWIMFNTIRVCCQHVRLRMARPKTKWKV